jgi:hypothetical protein
VAVGLEPQLLRERRLVVEEKAIFPSADMQVQAGTQVLQEAQVALQLRFFFPGDEAVLRQIFPGVSVARRAGNPEDRLQIAQSPRASLQLGSRL